MCEPKRVGANVGILIVFNIPMIFIIVCISWNNKKYVFDIIDARCEGEKNIYIYCLSINSPYNIIRFSSSFMSRDQHLWLNHFHIHKNLISPILTIFLPTFDLSVNEQKNILHEIRKLKANWIGHILRRYCLLNQVIEGKIKGEMEVTR